MTVDNVSSKIAACVSDARFHTIQKSFTSNRLEKSTTKSLCMESVQS